MEITISGQLLTFLQAMGIGCALWVVFDVFRILRMMGKRATVLIYIQDIVFFLLCGAVTYLFMLRSSSGEIRAFVLLGEILGAILYNFTISVLIRKIAQAIITFIGRYILHPIGHFLKNCVKFFKKKSRAPVGHVKKFGHRIKFFLKQTGVMLYNLVK